MKSWVRENLKNLSRSGELGKRATESPVVLNGAHPEKNDSKAGSNAAKPEASDNT